MKTIIKTGLLTIASFLLAENNMNAQWSLTGNASTNPPTNFVGTTDSQPLVIKTNNTEYMRILTSGNVGIGTTTPASKLDIEGGVSIGAAYSGTTAAPTNGVIIEGSVGIGTITPQAKLHVGTTINTSALVLHMDNPTNLGDYTALDFNRNSTQVNARIAAVLGTANTSGELALFTNPGPSSAVPIERMRINYAGNVGIGTTLPYGQLTVAGAGQASTSFSTSGSYLSSIVVGDLTGGTGNGGALLFAAGSGVWANNGVFAAIKSSVTNGTGPFGDIQFCTRTTANSATTTLDSKMTILGGGNVGIGTTTPGAKLEVAGQVKITGGSPGAGKVLASDADGLASWSSVGANGGWSTTGNSGTVDGTNFIGTTDNIPFNIRVNNEKAGRIDPTLANTFLGYRAGNANTTGSFSTAVGHQTLYSNTTGSQNVACGDFALQLNTAGNANTATGISALAVNTTGSYNAAVSQALVTNTTGSYNTGVGYGALGANYTGNYNTALGYQASPVGSNYSNSMFLGAYAGYWGGNNTIVLGNGNIEYLHCQVNLTVDSDKRIKDDIKENVPGLAFISKLRPVTYHYNIHRKDEIFGVKNDHDWDGKYDIEKRTMTGFIAQEVEQSANQIGYDFSGVDKPQNDKSIYGLRYAEFVVPLVKAVQEQQQMIDSLKTNDTSLKNHMNQQDSVIAALKKQMDQVASLINANNSSQSQSVTNFTNVELSNKNVIILNQNVPNPFAEQTTINYYLPDNTNRAQIIFFDQSGKIIKAVDLNEKGKGSLNVFANDLSSGIYTYSLIMDGQTMETKKMMKTK